MPVPVGLSPSGQLGYETPWLGASYVRILQALAHADRTDAVAEQWWREGFGDASITSFKGGGAIPACVAAISDSQIVLGISGTDSLRQVFSYASPLEVGVSFHPALAINQTFATWSRRAAQQIIKADAGAGREVVLFGHSYGGAVAMGAAIELRDRGYTAPIYCTTFGAPKYGGNDQTAALSTCNYRAWINEHDPIPTLPPSEGEIGWPLKLLWRGLLYVVLPPYRFKGPAYKMNFNGVYKNGTPDPLSPTLIQIFLSDQLFTDQILDPESHLLREYGRRLSLWDVRAPAGLRQTTRPVPVRQVNPVVNLPAQPANQGAAAIWWAERAVRQQLAVDVDAIKLRSGVGLVSIFEGGTMPYVPPEYVAKARVFPTRDWAVYWEGETISFGTRTQCKSLAKALNHFLRRLQVMEEFNLTGFNPSISTYANEASAGGLGFKPDILPVT